MTSGKYSFATLGAGSIKILLANRRRRSVILTTRDATPAFYAFGEPAVVDVHLSMISNNSPLIFTRDLIGNLIEMDLNAISSGVNNVQILEIVDG